MTRNLVLSISKCLALVALFGTIPGSANAQEKYPARPVEFIVPWGPGGGSDQTGRMIGKLLEADLKTSFPVLNVPGATGSTGITKMLVAPADGYAMAILAADTYGLLLTAAPKWTLKDITPVAVMIKLPSGLYVAEGSRFKSWADVERAAKTGAQPLKVAMSGLGSPDEITVNYFVAAGFRLAGVPFAKPGERYASLLGGHTDLLYSPVGNIKSYVDGKQMRPVLMLSPQRVQGFADVPSSKELGYQIQLPQFRAVVVKAGTDPRIVKFLSDALARVFAHPEYKKFLKDAAGSDDSYEAGQDALTFMHNELEAMKKTIESASRK